MLTVALCLVFGSSVNPVPVMKLVEVISGLQMLLHQAFAQVEQFTGLPAPRAAMAAVLS